MIYQEKEIRLKDGRTGQLRSPKTEDAPQMLAYLALTAGETPYLIRYPEECTETLEQEAAFLKQMADSPIDMMIICEVDGKIAGNCRLARHGRIKTRHRAGVAIALKKEFWGLGIGTAMFEEMILCARNWGVTQLELEVIDGNERAMGMYRKMGFQIAATKPDALRLKDGTMLSEHIMIKKL